MGTGIVSHDTNLMRDWSNTMNENNDNYEYLINRLYLLVDQFVGSDEFRGGLSTDFADKVLSQKPAFIKYSETFKECSELINSTAGKIDSDEAELKSRISAGNPLG